MPEQLLEGQITIITGGVEDLVDHLHGAEKASADVSNNVEEAVSAASDGASEFTRMEKNLKRVETTLDKIQDGAQTGQITKKGEVHRIAMLKNELEKVRNEGEQASMSMDEIGDELDEAQGHANQLKNNTDSMAGSNAQARQSAMALGNIMSDLPHGPAAAANNVGNLIEGFGQMGDEVGDGVLPKLKAMMGPALLAGAVTMVATLASNWDKTKEKIESAAMAIGGAREETLKLKKAVDDLVEESLDKIPNVLNEIEVAELSEGLKNKRDKAETQMRGGRGLGPEGTRQRDPSEDVEFSGTAQKILNRLEQDQSKIEKSVEDLTSKLTTEEFGGLSEEEAEKKARLAIFEATDNLDALTLDQVMERNQLDISEGAKGPVQPNAPEQADVSAPSSFEVGELDKIEDLKRQAKFRRQIANAAQKESKHARTVATLEAKKRRDLAAIDDEISDAENRLENAETGVDRRRIEARLANLRVERRMRVQKHHDDLEAEKERHRKEMQSERREEISDKADAIAEKRKLENEQASIRIEGLSEQLDRASSFNEKIDILRSRRTAKLDKVNSTVESLRTEKGLLLEKKNSEEVELSEKQLERIDELNRKIDKKLRKRLSIFDLFYRRKRQMEKKQEKKEEKQFDKRVKQFGKFGSQISEIGQAMNSMYSTWRQKRTQELKAAGKSEKQINKQIEEEGRKRFKRMKAIKMAGAIVNTISAGVTAFRQAQAASGPFGTALAVAEMATSLAAGYAQVRQIAATTIGGGVPGSAGGSGGASASFTRLGKDRRNDRVRNFSQEQERDRLAGEQSKIEKAVREENAKNRDKMDESRAIGDEESFDTKEAADEYEQKALS